MHFKSALLIASSAALIAAAPAPIEIGSDDVILHGQGRFAVMKRSDLNAYESEYEAARKAKHPPPMPSYLDSSLHCFTGNQTTNSTHKASKRDGVTLIVPAPSSRFLGWDVLMSSVVQGAPTTILVASGHSIANSIAVGVTADLTIVKDFLSVQTRVDYSTTWTTTQTQTFSAAVPAGKYGAFVSNAWTNRESGDVWTGNIGGDGTLNHYQADSYTSKAYGDLNWVDGVIQLCLGDQLPLKRCLGDGTL